MVNKIRNSIKKASQDERVVINHEINGLFEGEEKKHFISLKAKRLDVYASLLVLCLLAVFM
jgi:hypothetical protein